MNLLTLFLVLGLSISTGNSFAGIAKLDFQTQRKTYAFVVGIDRYDPRSPPVVNSLKYSESDARKVYDALTDETFGLASKSSSVLLLGSKATKSAILRSLEELRNRLQDDDTLIIYWTGHASALNRDASDADSGLVAYDSRTSESIGDIRLATELLPAAGRANTNVVFIGDACFIGSVAFGNLERASWRVTVMSASKSFESSAEVPAIGGSPLAASFKIALASAESDLDGDGYISVEEAFISLYPKVVTRTFSFQHPSLSGNYAHKALVSKVPLTENRILFGEAIPRELIETDSITINDRQVRIDRTRSSSNELVLLGSDSAGLVGQGVTYISNAKANFVYWRAGQTLQQFKTPYKRSYAVIIAIDDYSRASDPMRRGPTGYDARGFMVQRGKELKDALTHVGFAPSNILELYDQAATSSAIDNALKEFWKGGKYEDADRVFFYFGGHGDTFSDAGVLITYDFDKKQPTQTGFLMRDLTTRHSENIVARHVLFSLDACAAGLAVYKKLGGKDESVDPSRDELSIIRNDTESKARNFLVAGTGDQPALWDKGGIFTQALIAGLSGKADQTGRRLIQFRSLANYVSNEVARRAADKNVRQQVEDYSLTQIGNGRILFLFDGIR